MIVIGFLVSGSFVFRKLDYRRFFAYVASWCGILALNVAFLQVLVEQGVSAALAPLIVLPFNVVASYLIQRVYVFRRTGAGEGRGQDDKPER